MEILEVDHVPAQPMAPTAPAEKTSTTETLALSNGLHRLLPCAVTMFQLKLSSFHTMP